MDNTSQPTMDQRVLYEIMLRAYRLGSQANMDSKEIVQKMAGELRAYLQPDQTHIERMDRAELKRTNSKEVAG